MSYPQRKISVFSCYFPAALFQPHRRRILSLWYASVEYQEMGCQKIDESVRRRLVTDSINASFNSQSPSVMVRLGTRSHDLPESWVYPRGLLNLVSVEARRYDKSSKYEDKGNSADWIHLKMGGWRYRVSILSS
ncbi:hypothetical protein Tco_1568567 [Tanacetum coccineum]